MKKNAFTLVELLVVISIIAVLSTIGITTYVGIQAKARDSIRKGDLHKLATALELYAQQHNLTYVDGTPGANGDCTTANEDTTALYTNTAFTQLLSNNTVPPDPSSTSGNQIRYCYISTDNGQGFRLFAHLENCTGSGGNLCDYTNYNYSVVSDNITTIANAPTDTLAPIDGVWSDWDSCSVTACGSTGTQTRSCTSPAPANGGAPCTGSASQSCNTQACSFPSSGLVAYWKMDETTGTTVGDSFDGKNGTANSSTNITTSGKLGTAARTFNGSSQNVNMGDVLGFNTSDPFSISVWFKRTTLNDGYLISKQDDNNRHLYYNVGYIIYLYSNYVGFALSSSSSSSSYISSGTIVNDTTSWHQVVVTYNGSGNAAGMNIYVDGASDNPIRRNFSFLSSITNPKSFTLASSPDNTGWFRGTLDEIGVWNRALTASEVSALYNSGAGLTYTP